MSETLIAAIARAAPTPMTGAPKMATGKIEAIAPTAAEAMVMMGPAGDGQIEMDGAAGAAAGAIIGVQASPSTYTTATTTAIARG